MRYGGPRVIAQFPSRDSVLNSSGSEFALGLSYVAVSRVKTLGGLMFESAFDLSRFKEPEGKTPRDRAEDVRIRNEQLISSDYQLVLIMCSVEVHV
jgi:hypothetical protein